MFESDKPSKLNNIWWLLPVAAGLGLGQNLPPTWDVKGAAVVLYIASPILLVKAVLKEAIYELRTARISPDELIGVKVQEPKQYKNLNSVYSQDVQHVKVNASMEKRFAQVLLAMRGLQPNDEAVDLREEFWIQKGKRDKFQNRDEFKQVRDKWEAAVIVAKKADRKNAPYCVVNWDSVGRIAKGERLA